MGSSFMTTEQVWPVLLIFCIDVEFLESPIELSFVRKDEIYEVPTDGKMRTILEIHCKELKEAIILEAPDSIVKHKLLPNMKNKNAAAGMQELFDNYHTTFSRNVLKWIIKANQLIYVHHVLSAVRLVSFQERITSDPSISHHNLHKIFTGFLRHSICLWEVFQIVDRGPKWTAEGHNDNNFSWRRRRKTGPEKKEIRVGMQEKTLRKKKPNCSSVYGHAILRKKTTKFAERLSGMFIGGKEEAARRACTETFRRRTL